MKQKLLFLKSVMTVLLALFSLGAFAYDAEVDGISYNLDRTTITASVTRNNIVYPEGDVNIPESITYNDTVWTVTSIEDRAFYPQRPNRNLLTSVTIPSSVISIGSQAFRNCMSLTSITIGSSVTSIGDYAFDGCTSLTTITVDADNANYSSINGAVYDKAGTTLILCPQGRADYPFSIPTCVTTISGYAFNGCTLLKLIFIPASVTTIEQNAFSGTNISSIDCHADLQNLTWADTESFASSSPKPTCYVEGEAWVWEEKFPDVKVRFRGSGPSVGDMFYVDRMRYVVTSEKDKTVELMSFSGNGSYVALDIPAVVNDSFDDYVGQDFTVTSIGQRAFADQWSITSVTIPASVTSIGSEAFSECRNLTSVTFAEGSQLTSIGSGAFEWCPLASITIPASVTSMEGAFSSCRRLTSINVDPNNAIYSSKDGVVFDKTGTTLLLYPQGKSDISYIIPDGVTSIGRGAFSGSICQSVTIPTSVTDINKGAFYDCGIISVTLPDGVMSIGEEAFAWCGNLVSVTIPASVASVGQYAFAASTNVADVYCYAAPDALQYFFFSEGTGVNWRSFKPEKGTKLHVADASAWEMFANANVTIVGDLNDFFVEDNLRYKKIHQTETRASVRKAEGQDVVEVVGCVTSPTGAVDIPASVKHDGVDYAVTSIGENAFTNCSGMTSVTIPSSVTNIEDGAFEGCTGLTDVYCNADPAQLTWSADAQSFMADKATKFHVEDASAWSAFSDANVTFVDDKTPDDIEGIDATDTADGAWYTLTGVKLEGEPTEKGVYVKDGKKYFIR
ncbi:MAG: leucine-rich repeat domain-containing protein [Bacteroidaceae bacterium]|nr:leucine-rich repeat domain-containing protein [Bacteroidaceae bacterium]